MASFSQREGTIVSIGDFSNGLPTITTDGRSIASPDPGVPLARYAPAATSPKKLWRSQPALRKVVSYAARQVGSVSLHHYIRQSADERVRDSDSTLEKLLRNPAGDGTVTRSKLIRDYVTDRMLYDVSCILYVDGTLVRVPPPLLEITSDFLGRLTRVRIVPGNNVDPIDITDAPKALGWGWSADGAGGVPPTETLSEILDEFRQSVTWRKRRWQESVKQPMLLTRPANAPKWSKENRDRFLRSWEKWKSENSEGTPILENGMEVSELSSLTPVDAQDIQGRQLTDAEVASFFHIPPELVGARETNFSAVTAYRRMVFGTVLGPIMKDVQQEFTAGLLPGLETRDNTYVEFDFAGALAASPEERVRMLTSAAGGPYMTRAEARAAENLPRIEGTDELITPKNVSEGGQTGPRDTGSQNAGADPRDQYPSDDEAELEL